MMTQFLVPLDGSELADRILPDVIHLSAGRNVQVRILRVLPEAGDRKDTWDRRTEVGEAEKHLDDVRLRLVRKGVFAETDLRSGNDVVHEILKYAVEHRPSLIAMCTHGRTGLDRMLGGSVAEGVLRDSAFPVYLSNPLAQGDTAHRTRPSFRRILVPLDGASRSDRILPLVIDLSRVDGADVTLLHVENPLALVMLSPGAACVQPPTDPQEHHFLDAARKHLEHAGVTVRTAVCTDNPVEGIVEATRKHGTDLVAMTTHGRTGFDRWIHGSVAETVLHRVRCPMVIQRTATRAWAAKRSPRRSMADRLKWSALGPRWAPAE